MKRLLEIQDLSYRRNRFQDYVFQNIRLSVDVGEKVAVYGGVNSGKSALVDLIIGLIQTKNNEIIRVPDIAVVTQDFTLYPDLTVRENLEFTAMINDFPVEKAGEIIGSTGLEAWADTQARRLPNALKQLLQLACALARHFELLILDEPTVCLDTRFKQKFWEIIDRLASEEKGILLVTGVLEDAARCGSVLHLPSGRPMTDEAKDFLQMGEVCQAISGEAGR